MLGPGEPVANDYYIRNRERSQLTYRVPRGIPVTVLTAGPRSTPITVSELAAIVQGRNPRRRPLFDRGRNLGYWVMTAGDTVRSIDQQYQP